MSLTLSVLSISFSLFLFSLRMRLILEVAAIDGMVRVARRSMILTVEKYSDVLNYVGTGKLFMRHLISQTPMHDATIVIFHSYFSFNVKNKLLGSVVEFD
mmetsp:Transcript_24749/g.50053  ORF Transcript_24749/g.50053 Transcript_24749/m.50053 type:complete len:100 (+) Transcript_24749:641-940(+)